jgi:NlpC/P60 family putative phage cell wall peptidase
MEEAAMETSELRIPNSEWSVESAKQGALPIPYSPLATRPDAVARAWIGTPYVHQESVKGVGCDCLGLLRGVWRELRGPEPEAPPPYSPDWAEAGRAETLYMALARHLTEIDPVALGSGDVALFRMVPRGPAKHCGIVADGNDELTLIHARQNRRVAEEPLAPFWRRRLAYAFRM